MIDFAYVSFVNYNLNYIELMKSTIKSVIIFSKYSLILYCVDFPADIVFPFEEHNQLIIRHIRNINLPNIYYYKPFVIIDAIKNGLDKGYYIESDDILTPNADAFLYEQSLLLCNIPISPIHPDNVQIPSIDKLIVDSLIQTQHYIHGHVLFSSTCLAFIEEWLNYCLKYDNFKNADETVLNLLYWKNNCSKHYLDIIDPWYECFYSDSKYHDKACTFHGCKDPMIQSQLLNDMIVYYRYLKNI